MQTAHLHFWLRAGMAALGLGACKADIPDGVFACDTTADCPAGYACLLDADREVRRCQKDESAASCSAKPYLPYDDAITWTKLDLTFCEVLCARSDTACIARSCSHGMELAACIRGNRGSCAAQAGGSCHALWNAAYCCSEANCAGLTDEEFSDCADDACGEEFESLAWCVVEDSDCGEQAWDECAASALSSPQTSDAGQIRIDGGASDAGTQRSDAGPNRPDAGPSDAGADAGINKDGGLRNDAGASDGGFAIKDGGGPPREAGAADSSPAVDDGLAGLGLDDRL